MKLLSVRVTNYKSIQDSGWVSIDNVTCLVGKNESGKTAFLQALRRLSPLPEEQVKFDILDYPRKNYTDYKKIHQTSPAIAVSAKFELSNDELNAIESELGKGILISKFIEVSKNYLNNRTWSLDINETVGVKTVVSRSSITEEINQKVNNCKSLDELNELIKNVEDSSLVESLINNLNRYNNNLKGYIIEEFLCYYIPKFLYFDDYNIMEGNIDITKLKSRIKSEKINESDRAFLALLFLTGSTIDDFNNQSNYEQLKAELEAASIKITDEVFEFWSQNKQLEVEFDISTENQQTILHIRIKNNRHRVSVPFDERSRGFVWFFSFLSYFSKLEDEDSNIILLLDEPGLSLHAKAQNDFLKFIDDRLSQQYQVIYTTHSPFMIDPNKLERVRTVEDVDKKGTIISQDMLKTDKDTVFPLQAALGYDLAQTLFVGPNCLLVEGPSDLIYLQVLSQSVEANELPGLDPKWVIVPVGGADKVATFVSLLGSNKLNIVVLIDIATKDQQRIKTLQENALLGNKNLLNIGEFIGSSNADMEDIFEPSFYLKLVNGAYNSYLDQVLTTELLSLGNPRIIKRVEKYFGDNSIADGKFNHYRPAVYLLKEQFNLLPDLDSCTIDRAAALFDRINSLLN